MPSAANRHPTASRTGPPADLAGPLLDGVLACAVSGTGASGAFLATPGPDGARVFRGRSAVREWLEETPPLIEDAIDRAIDCGELVHVEGDAIGREFGEAPGVAAVAALPIPSSGGASGAALAVLSGRSIGGSGLELLGALARQTSLLVDLERLYRRAACDGLTGLLARAEFEERLREALELDRGAEGPVSLLLVDVDGLDRVNRSHGLSAGDRVLVEVAGLLSRAARPGDVVARHGGDEFAVLLPATDLGRASELAGKWVEEARVALAGDASQVEVTISIGAAEASSPHEDAASLLAIRAAEALALAKAAGPGRAAAWASEAEGKADAADRLAGLFTGRPAADYRNALHLLEALRVAGELADPNRILVSALDFLLDASGALRGRIGLGERAEDFEQKIARQAGGRDLDPPGEFDALALAQALEGSPRAKLVEAAIPAGRKTGRTRPGPRLFLPLPGPRGVVGAIDLEFEGGHRVGARDLYLLRALARPIAAAIANSLLVREVIGLKANLEERVSSQERELTRLMRKASPKARSSLKYDYSEIIGDSPPMIDVFLMLDKVIDSTVPVLVLGESGTGKELIARAIHFKGPRKSKPFVSENCAAVTETLLESELFGYVKGSFTGANQNKRGLFEVADGGTLFLDEVGDMSPGMQKKLLRALQDGEIRPVGSKSVKHVDTRIIAATNKDLQKAMRAGEFREDLFYRLNVVSVHLPPLRERGDDLRILLEFFVKKTCQELGVTKRLDPEAERLLLAYHWPGNIREIENEVKRFVALSDEVIDRDILSPAVLAAAASRAAR